MSTMLSGERALDAEDKSFVFVYQRRQRTPPPNISTYFQDMFPSGTGWTVPAAKRLHTRYDSAMTRRWQTTFSWFLYTSRFRRKRTTNYLHSKALGMCLIYLICGCPCDRIYLNAILGNYCLMPVLLWKICFYIILHSSLICFSVMVIGCHRSGRNDVLLEHSERNTNGQQAGEENHQKHFSQDIKRRNLRKFCNQLFYHPAGRSYSYYEIPVYFDAW